MTSKQAQKVAFKPRRLGHVNLTVSDLQRSMEFYNQVLGIEQVRWEPDINAGFLSNGNTHHDVALIEAGVLEKEPVLNHLGWELENQVEQVGAYERALQAGIKIDFKAYHQISYGIYLSDPRGQRPRVLRRCHDGLAGGHGPRTVRQYDLRVEPRRPGP